MSNFQTSLRGFSFRNSKLPENIKRIVFEPLPLDFKGLHRVINELGDAIDAYVATQTTAQKIEMNKSKDWLIVHRFLKSLKAQCAKHNGVSVHDMDVHEIDYLPSWQEINELFPASPLISPTPIRTKESPRYTFTIADAAGSTKFK